MIFPPADWRERTRRHLILLLLVAASVVVGQFVNRHYPIKDWLFVHIASYWLASAGLVLAFLSLGDFVLARLLPRSLAGLARWPVAFALGLFGFELAMFGCGLAQLFHGPLFFALPLACIALGGAGLYRRGRRWLRHLRAARRRSLPLSPLYLAFVAFGLFELGLIYFSILAPDNAQFDSRWKHLAIAEDFVAAGGVHRFSEGWVFSTRVHFTSYLYTWAFLRPGGLLFDRIVLAAHVEFVVFVWTVLVGIPALVRRLVPRADPRLSWLVRLLFPGVLVYDSSLSIGADHVGAMYCVPLYLVGELFLRKLSPRYGVLLGLLLAGVTLVKESLSVMLVPVPIALVAGRALWLGCRQWKAGSEAPRRRHYFWQGPLVAALVALVATTPFWLKNWVWHGNPLYPQAAKYFNPRPWTADASYLYDWGYRDFQFAGSQTFGEMLKVLPTFSFVPHEFGAFHGKVPTFGFLFTLLVACLPFLKGQKRVWPTVVWVHVAMMFWYWVHPYDRYLQGLMPLMAASTAATMVLIHRQADGFGRAALGLLVAIQVVWGADQYFYQTHAMTRSSPKRVLDLLDAGYRGRYEERFETQKSWAAVGRAVPKDALLLRHESHDHLGVGVRTLEDWLTYQFAISYGTMKSAREVQQKLQELGVTHLQWFTRSSRSWDSLAGDIRFFDFVLNHADKPKQVGRSTVAVMPSAPPTAEIGSQVLVFGCQRGYRSGLYDLEQLRVPSFGPQSRKFPKPRERVHPDDVDLVLDESIGAIVLDPECGSTLPASAHHDFVLALQRRAVPRLKNPKYQVYVRRLRGANNAPARSRPAPSEHLELEEPDVDDEAAP